MFSVMNCKVIAEMQVIEMLCDALSCLAGCPTYSTGPVRSEWSSDQAPMSWKLRISWFLDGLVLVWVRMTSYSISTHVYIYTLNYTFLYLCYCFAHITEIYVPWEPSQPQKSSGLIVIQGSAMTNTLEANLWAFPGSSKPDPTVGYMYCNIHKVWLHLQNPGIMWGPMWIFFTCRFRLHWSGSRLLVQEERQQFFHSDTDTVDGRNPATVDGWFIYRFTALLQGFIHPRWWSPDFWSINSSDQNFLQFGGNCEDGQCPFLGHSHERKKIWLFGDFGGIQLPSLIEICCFPI